MVNGKNHHLRNDDLSSEGPCNDKSIATGDDLRIQTMLGAVAVPENLNARIKSRLRMAMLVDPCAREASSIDTVRIETSNTDALNVETVIQPEERKLVAALDSSERTSGAKRPTAWLGERTRRAVLVLAMAAVFAGMAYVANQWRQPTDGEWLVQQCHTILGNFEQDNPANLEVETNLADLPSSVREQLARVTLRGTRSLVALGSKFKGKLYRLDAADSNTLVLMRLTDLPAVRGLNSRFTTLDTPSGGWSFVALQLNNETYVLAAECTAQQLMNYIRRPVVT